MKVEINLTPAQMEIWNWAQDAAREFWEDDEGRDDGIHFEDCPVGVAEGGKAQIELHWDVFDDMKYRIGDQLHDMACEQGGIDVRGHADKERMKALKDIPVANRIVEKLDALASKHDLTEQCLAQ